jgi:ubiquinone/menaquinone biosynthesis C-methylase UbiE
MSEHQIIPFWGPEQLELFELMAQAIDPEDRISLAMQNIAPIEGRVMLDVGAGVGDRTIRYACLASHVYALEPDPAALPILRCCIKSSGLSNITVVHAGAEEIPMEDSSTDVVYATWAYFFGPGSEPGLREVERVVRPGGDIVVVQNYGHDELSLFWSSKENECETWPTWFNARGFSCQVIDTIWRFRTQDETLAVLEFLWGERARSYVLKNEALAFNYRVAIYHHRTPKPR